MHHHHHRRCHVLLSSSSLLPYHHGLLKLHHLCMNLLFIHAYYCKQKRTFFSPNSSNGSSKGGPQRIFSIRQSLAAIDKMMLLKHTIIFIIGTVCMDIDEVDLFVLHQGIYRIVITIIFSIIIIIIDNIDTTTSSIHGYHIMSYRRGARLPVWAVDGERHRIVPVLLHQQPHTKNSGLNLQLDSLTWRWWTGVCGWWRQTLWYVYLYLTNLTCAYFHQWIYDDVAV